MKFSNYELTSIIGSNYHNGNISFTNTGKNLLCPIGNNLAIVYLERDQSRTLAIESSYDIDCLAVSPKNLFCACVNESGECSIVSLVSGEVLFRHKFKGKVSLISFSPNGTYLVAVRDKAVFIFESPNPEMILEPLNQLCVHDISSHPVTSIDWTSDSRAFIISHTGTSSIITGFRKNKRILSMPGHDHQVIGAHFMKDSLDCFTVVSNGSLCFYSSEIPLKNLKMKEVQKIQNKKKKMALISFKPRVKHEYKDTKDLHLSVSITATTYHKESKKLVSGIKDGTILIHQMPDFLPLQIVTVGKCPVSSMDFDASGFLIAIGSKEHSRVDIYDWLARTYVYQSIGHSRSTLTSVDYSPDGTKVLTGALDGTVKLWNVVTGKCLANFTESENGIVSAKFSKQNMATIYSVSIDGHIRGYDVNNFKNFCNITVTDNSSDVKFKTVTSMAVDHHGEHVAVAIDTDDAAYLIFVWRIRSRLLAFTLPGHLNLISSLEFFMTRGVDGDLFLISGSQDESVRFWSFSEDVQCFETESQVYCVTVRPDGKEFSVALKNRYIKSYDTDKHDLIREINTGFCLEHTKLKGELYSSKKSQNMKYIDQLAYSSNGNYLLCGGESKYILIFDVSINGNGLLLTLIPLCANLSIPGVQMVHNRRKLKDDLNSNLPKNKRLNAVISVKNVRFSPDGSGFAVACPGEGVLIFTNEKVTTNLLLSSHVNYSTDEHYVGGGRGVDLSGLTRATPNSVMDALDKKDWVNALEGSLVIGGIQLLTKVVGKIPKECIDYVVSMLSSRGDVLVQVRLLKWLTTSLKHKIGSKSKRLDEELLLCWLYAFFCKWKGLQQLKTIDDVANEMSSCGFKDFATNVYGTVSGMEKKIDKGIQLLLSQYNLLNNMLEFTDDSDVPMEVEETKFDEVNEDESDESIMNE